MQRAANGGGHRADSVGIAAEVSAQHGTAVRIGIRQFHHGDSAGNRFNGAGSRADDLIELFAGRFDAVGMADNV